MMILIAGLVGLFCGAWALRSASIRTKGKIKGGVILIATLIGAGVGFLVIPTLFFALGAAHPAIAPAIAWAILAVVTYLSGRVFLLFTE